MKTHKNPDLRLSTPTPYKASPNASPKPFKSFQSSPKQQQPVKPPVMELQDKKWVVVSAWVQCVFTHLKLWIAVARHNFKWVKTHKWVEGLINFYTIMFLFVAHLHATCSISCFYGYLKQK